MASTNESQHAPGMEGHGKPESLVASKLGTRAYWDEIYARERRNFRENEQDEGEVWFGEDSEDKIIDYLTTHMSASSPTSVLDLGCGNGHLLFRMHEEGFANWRMHGIDYSPDAIALAHSIASTRGMTDITFSVIDFLAQQTETEVARVDIVLDKGTFDAISLSDQRTSDGRKIHESYATAVCRLMKDDALLLITSCNWTEEELKTWMTNDGALIYDSHIKRPKFSFGGATGTTIATVAFRKA